MVRQEKRRKCAAEARGGRSHGRAGLGARWGAAGWCRSGLRAASPARRTARRAAGWYARCGGNLDPKRRHSVGFGHRLDLTAHALRNDADLDVPRAQRALASNSEGRIFRVQCRDRVCERGVVRALDERCLEVRGARVRKRARRKHGVRYVPVAGKLPCGSVQVPVYAPWRSCQVVRPFAVSTPRMSALIACGSPKGTMRVVSESAATSGKKKKPISCRLKFKILRKKTHRRTARRRPAKWTGCETYLAFYVEVSLELSTFIIPPPRDLRPCAPIISKGTSNKRARTKDRRVLISIIIFSFPSGEQDQLLHVFKTGAG